ncbi:MAG: hypothetical protein OEU50_17035 [Gammaproteobacteria bacterium]|nr:hypothetical protein [Gammaproteobacteria bacterium]
MASARVNQISSTWPDRAASRSPLRRPLSTAVERRLVIAVLTSSKAGFVEERKPG